MAEDTAVLDPATAEGGETPPADVLPETGTPPSPETAVEETPETGEATGDQEDASPWAGKTPEEIEAELTKRVKDAEARARESERRKHQDELTKREAETKTAAEIAAREAQVKAASEVRQTHAVRSLAQIVAKAKEGWEGGMETLDVEALGKLAAALDYAAAATVPDVARALSQAYLAEKFPGFRASAEVNDRFLTAQRKGDVAGMHAATFDAVAEAIRERDLPEMTEKRLAEIVAERAEKEAAAKAAEADKQRKSAPGASTVSGVGAGTSRGNRDVIASDDTSLADKLAAFQAEHGMSLLG